MSAEPFLLDLEARGFLPWSRAEDLGAHVSSAFVRPGPASGVHDLVLVVDRTNPEGLPPNAAAPHRTNRRPGPFALPLAEVLRVARAVPATFLAPLRRVTIVEILDTPPTPDDLARIDGYVSPKGGPILVCAMLVDASGRTVHGNDGAKPSAMGLSFVEDAADWARKAYDAPTAEAAPRERVALFGPRMVGGVSFFLSPIGGAALLGWNLYRTRRRALALALFAATSLALLVVVLATGDGGGGRALATGANIGAVLFFATTTRRLFGEPVRRAGLGLGVLLAVASLTLVVGGGIFVAGAWETMNEREITTSNGATLFHDRATSADHARRAGEILRERGVLTGPGSGARLAQDGKTHSVHLTFGDEHAHEAAEVKAFYVDVARELSKDPFGGEPVTVVFDSRFGTELAHVSSP